METLKTTSKYAVEINNDNCRIRTGDVEYDLMLLRNIERNANIVLSTRGYLFLRDVYEMIGIPITRDSVTVGWVYEENNQIGDNYVKFDISYIDYEKAIVDFNVDGDILDRIRY